MTNDPQALGELLHEKMASAIEEAGYQLPAHPDDPAHDIAVGEALALIMEGKVWHGVQHYNGWAREAGYPPIILKNLNPVRVDIGPSIGGMIAELRDGEVQILSVGEWVRPGYVKRRPGFYTPLGSEGDVVMAQAAE